MKTIKYVKTFLHPHESSPIHSLGVWGTLSSLQYNVTTLSNTISAHIHLTHWSETCARAPVRLYRMCWLDSTVSWTFFSCAHCQQRIWHTN